MEPWIILAGSPLLAPLLSKTAYLDPGSGSILLQLLIAGALGALVVLRTSWGRIKGFFQRNAPGEQQEDQEDDEQP